MTGKFNAELRDKLVPLGELKPDPDNARTHDDRNLLAIACYAMEINPAYCDIIVNRWQALTGRTAERQAA